MPEKEISKEDFSKREGLNVPVQIEKVKLIDNQKIQIEFRIVDLIKQLKIDILGPVASCSGCNRCKA